MLLCQYVGMSSCRYVVMSLCRDVDNSLIRAPCLRPPPLGEGWGGAAVPVYVPLPQGEGWGGAVPVTSPSLRGALGGGALIRQLAYRFAVLAYVHALLFCLVQQGCGICVALLQDCQHGA